MNRAITILGGLQILCLALGVIQHDDTLFLDSLFWMICVAILLGFFVLVIAAAQKSQHKPFTKISAAITLLNVFGAIGLAVNLVS